MKVSGIPPRKFGFLFCIYLFASCGAHEPRPDTLAELVDDIVNPHIALGSNVGIMVGIVKGPDRTFYSYGERELGSREKMTPRTIFEIASITKVFTALALADMHLRGEVDLNDPVEKNLPPQVEVPSRNGTKITLKQLANHTSGLPRQPSNMDEDADDPYKGYTERNMYDFLGEYSLSEDPGVHFEYSNLGYGLLGQALSLKEGSDYESVISRHVLEPLGMTSTSINLSEDQRGRLARGHNGNRKVALLQQENITQGGGALKSDMEDMLTFLEANMRNTSPLREAIALSQEITFTDFSVLDWKTEGIALGWEVFTIGGRSIYCKNGGNVGFTTFIGFDKAAGNGVVILSNSSLRRDIFPTLMGFEILKGMVKLP